MAVDVVGNKARGAKLQLVGIERVTGEANFTIDYTRNHTRNCTRNCTRNICQQAAALSSILRDDDE